MPQNNLFDMPVSVISDTPFVGSVIYETRGKAREYRELSCNLYLGCDHGCVYCYAPNILHKERPEFYKTVQPRKDIIEKLEKDTRGYVTHGDKRQVLFCFACDPYSSADQKFGITRQAIQVCRRNGMGFCVLTKGGRRSLRDIDLFSARDSYACTLTTLDEKLSRKWEPGADIPEGRLLALKKYHDKGIKTWVSLEPVLFPEQTLDTIRETHGYVDEYKVGVLNYHEQAKQVDWYKFARDVVALLDSLGAKYYLKFDLRKYLQ